METPLNNVWFLIILVVGYILKAIFGTFYEVLIEPGVTARVQRFKNWLETRLSRWKKEDFKERRLLHCLAEEPPESLSFEEKMRVASTISNAELRVLKDYKRKGCFPFWRNVVRFVLLLALSIVDVYLVYLNIAYLHQTPPVNWQSFIVPVAILSFFLPILFDALMKSLATLIVYQKLKRAREDQRRSS